MYYTSGDLGLLRRWLQPLLRFLRRAFGTDGLAQELRYLQTHLDTEAARLSDKVDQLNIGISDLRSQVEDRFARLAETTAASIGNLQSQTHNTATWLAETTAASIGNLQTQTHNTATWLAETTAVRLDRVDAVMASVVNRVDAIEAATSRFRAVYLGGGRVLLRFRHLPLVYLADASDRLIVPHLIQEGEYETEVTAWLLVNVRPTDICLDIGANLGYHTCIMARQAREGRVVAVEPDPEVFDLLVENVNINWLEAVALPKCIAVSQAPGELTLYRLRNRSANTSIAAMTEAEATEAGVHLGDSFVTPCVTVDNLMAHHGSRVDVMKVDVEGAEPLVLRGARRTIQENPSLSILMEWSPAQLARAGGSAEALLDEIQAQGLAIHRLRLDGTEEDAADRSLMLSTRYWNVVLRRSERGGLLN